jgi:hypothetical protein
LKLEGNATLPLVTADDNTTVLVGVWVTTIVVVVPTETVLVIVETGVELSVAVTYCVNMP